MRLLRRFHQQRRLQWNLRHLLRQQSDQPMLLRAVLPYLLHSIPPALLQLWSELLHFWVSFSCMASCAIDALLTSVRLRSLFMQPCRMKCLNPGSSLRGQISSPSTWKQHRHHDMWSCLSLQTRCCMILRPRKKQIILTLRQTMSDKQRCTD